MGFDWMSFATGFLERTEEIRSTREEEAKTYEEEQRRAAERNATEISRRRAIADQVTGYASYLTSNGVSNEQLQAVIASGPQAIEQLTSRVQAAVQANGGRPLGASDIDTLITMPEGFTPMPMTTQEYIDQTYGLTVQPVEAPQQDYGFLDVLGGRDQMSRAEARLRRTPYAEGMTIEEINRAASQGAYRSLIPGTFVSIAGRDTYDADANASFMSSTSRIMNALESSSRWNETLGLPTPAAKAEAQRELLIEALDPAIRLNMGQYGPSFFDAQEGYLRNLLGDDYVDSLVTEATEAPEDMQTPQAVPTGGTTQPSAVTPGVVTGNRTPAGTEDDITVETLPPVQQGAQPTVATEAPSMTTPTTATPPVAPRAEEVEIPEEANQLPEPPADATVTVEGGGSYTYEEWQGMTRTERVTAGLPTSQLGAQFYFNRFSAGIGGLPSIDDIVGPAGEGNAEQRLQYEQLVEDGYGDETIALLNSHGRDMLNYIREQGADTNEEMFMAITEYGKQNNLVMPFDKTGLINAFNTALENR
jgi:hypothetical protein